MHSDGVSVLRRSFLFLPGIGPVREAMLWRRGVTTWSLYRDLERLPGIRPRTKSQHDGVLAVAEERLGRDPGFFARLLPASEHWRAFATFHEDAAYLDIETTGDRTNAVTVVGVRRRGVDRAFVRGADYTPEAVSEALAGVSCLVTFNGAAFDVPVLRAEGVRFPDVPHVDLRPVLARAGYTGGLKKIEETLGLPRVEGVAGLSGWDAVKLWRKWEDRRDRAALDKLVAYNLADASNLEPLARFACAHLEQALLTGVKAQSRLPEASAGEVPAGR